MLNGFVYFLADKIIFLKGDGFRWEGLDVGVVVVLRLGGSDCSEGSEVGRYDFLDF